MNLCFSVRLRISTGTSSSDRDSYVMVPSSLLTTRPLRPVICRKGRDGEKSYRVSTITSWKRKRNTNVFEIPLQHFQALPAHQWAHPECWGEGPRPAPPVDPADPSSFAGPVPLSPDLWRSCPDSPIWLERRANVNYTVESLNVSFAAVLFAHQWGVQPWDWREHWKQAWWSPVQTLARHFEWSLGRCSFSSFSSSSSLSLSLVLFWWAMDLLGKERVRVVLFLFFF